MFLIDAIVILHKGRILGWRFIILTEISQVANMLLISNKISMFDDVVLWFSGLVILLNVLT